MWQFWFLSLRNLRRNSKRNLATGCAIAFGFCGILLLQAYAFRVENFLRVHTLYSLHTGHIVLLADQGFDKFRYNPRKYSLTPEDQRFILNALKDEAGIEAVEKQITGQGLLGNGCISLPFIARGLEPAVDKILRAHPQVKEWMPNQKFLKSGQGLSDSKAGEGLLLSLGLATALGKTTMLGDIPPGAPITLVDCAAPDVKEQLKKDSNVQLLSGTWRGAMSAVDGEAIGIFQTGFQEADNSAILADVALLQKLFDTENVERISVWLKDDKKIPELSKKLNEKFAAAGKKYDLVSWNEERLSPYYFGSKQFLDTLSAFVSMILAAVIALSVLNSTTMTIMERSQEIGMYRAMGFRRRQVRRLYLQESLLLSLISLGVGTLLTIAVILAINSANIVYYPPGVSNGMVLRFVLNESSAAKAAGMILVLVLLATFMAVSSRLRQKPADLLGGTLR
ncbi:MAG: ABC transporter permease [Bacteriovoracia bacterium]